MKWVGWLRGYAAHPDPATGAVNLVALVIASNGPFYPLYVLALIGWAHSGAWLTMLASPFFMLVPMVSRYWPAGGRAALPLIGIVNTVWCTALLGSGSAVNLFLLPCIALTALQYRGDEWWCRLLLLGLAIGTECLLVEFPLTGLMHLRPDQDAALVRLNVISVATLSGFLALTLAGLLREAAAQTVPAD